VSAGTGPTDDGGRRTSWWSTPWRCATSTRSSFREA